DTLASMFSLGVGGHLGQSMLGPRFAGFQREMDLRAGLALRASERVESPREIPGFAGKFGRPALPSWLAKVGGVSAFLSERIAFAQGTEGAPHASSIEAQVATVLATAAVGGLLFWGAKAIRDHYVAPAGRIKDIQGFRAEIAATTPEKLLEQVRQSEQYLQQAKAYDRNNDEAIAVESLQFLAQAMPHLPPEQRLARMEIFWDYLRDVGDHNSYLAIRAIKDSARHLPREALASFMGKATIGLNFKDPDRLLNTIFVLMALMPHQDPERRKELSLSIGDALARREKEITEHLDYLRKSKLLLKDLKDFMDERLAKSKQELKQKIRELERKRDGDGLMPDLAKATLVDRLKKQLENLKDDDEADLLNAFREHLYEKDEVSPFWVHTLALDNAERLQEVFGEVESGEPIIPKHRPTLRERLDCRGIHLLISPKNWNFAHPRFLAPS
ncbi:MAG: hypothetical protein K8R69_09010, partial [Deltaproteobacteria bacterium]|nr:hypothetical protein [Deltaproteobacteria bacterium]